MTRKQAIERDGFVVVPNLLSAGEISSLKDALVCHFAVEWEWAILGKHQPNAAIRIPEIAWLIAHAPVVSIFRELYGQETLVFTGNCDAHANMLSFWHKDVTANGDQVTRAAFSRPECRIYRAGVYLQDHDRRRDGLTVRQQSHLSTSKTTGDVTHVKTKAGDVVFFDARLTHRGMLPDWFEHSLYRLTRRFGAPKLGFQIKELYWKATGQSPKLSIFFTYGGMNKFTRDFCAFEFRAKCKDMDARNRVLPASLSESLSQAGVVSYSSLLEPDLISSPEAGHWGPVASTD
jgi:hypothetical protein